MSLVATVVVDPKAATLDGALVDRLSAALPVADVAPLRDGVAADLSLAAPPGADARALTAAARAALGDAPADVLVQEAAGRRKRLLVSDMDSTLIGQECIDELAGAVGLKEQVASITERAMRGEIAFEPALRERVALLAGVPVAEVATLLATRIRLTPGAAVLVATMRAHGAYTALVSGGFTAFTGPVRDALDMHEAQANRLVEQDGVFTGAVIEPVLGKAAKRERLDALVQELGIAHREVVAIGDGANDLAMIEAAGLGIAFRAKPAVAAAAGAEIRFTDLATALYYQGYRAADFAEPKAASDVVVA